MDGCLDELVLYCYATGSCITELECNGHMIEDEPPVVRMYSQNDNNGTLMAAEEYEYH